MIGFLKSRNYTANVVARQLHYRPVWMQMRIPGIQGGNTVINLIVWLLVGALIGWLASMVMRTDAQQGALMNIVVGIIGAMIGGFILGGPTINSNALNVTALVVSFVGAVVLLAIVNLVTRGRVR
jgi:uncharacterized membrane protein YeaQ/YmgE (transglycosylase-associated protein family)